MHRRVVRIGQVDGDVFVVVGAQRQTAVVGSDGEGPMLPVDEHRGVNLARVALQDKPNGVNQRSA